MSRAMSARAGGPARSLPFLIGPEPASAERCFLLTGAPMNGPRDRPGARRVIVAHRLLERARRPVTPPGRRSRSTFFTWPAASEVVTVPSGSGSKSRW